MQGTILFVPFFLQGTILDLHFAWHFFPHIKHIFSPSCASEISFYLDLLQALLLPCKSRHLLMTWPCLLFITVFLTITLPLVASTVTTKQMAFVSEQHSRKYKRLLCVFTYITYQHINASLSFATPLSSPWAISFFFISQKNFQWQGSYAWNQLLVFFPLSPAVFKELPSFRPLYTRLSHSSPLSSPTAISASTVLFQSQFLNNKTKTKEGAD